RGGKTATLISTTKKFPFGDQIFPHPAGITTPKKIFFPPKKKNTPAPKGLKTGGITEKTLTGGRGLVVGKRGLEGGGAGGGGGIG
ncbi:hypothetical protein DNR41_27475, partial [Escherichia coli]